jgi:pSer/pThr/pTyr-binding forkhead associated (FHA) protein
MIVTPEFQCTVADTGSTNGTFISGERISYGQPFALGDDRKVRFGSIEVEFRPIGPEPTEKERPLEIVEEDQSAEMTEAAEKAVESEPDRVPEKTIEIED